MRLVNTKDMLRKAYKKKYAIGAFNVDNVDIAKAVLKGAEKANSAVIIAVSESARLSMGPNNVKNFIESVTKDLKIPVALHLDHGKSFEVCKAAIDEGYTSVMIDASDLPFEENIKVSKKVVEYARPRGVTVEAELGMIAGIEDHVVVEDKYGKFTHPDDVVEFVKRTGCDSLAIAIGTAHGAIKFKPGQKPELRFDILEEIQQKLPGFPLVLHGASSVPVKYRDIINQYGGQMKEAIGIPEEMLRKASQNGVAKINVGTDVRFAFLAGLREALTNKPNKFAMRDFFDPSFKYVEELVERKIIEVLGSKNSAVRKG